MSHERPAYAIESLTKQLGSIKGRHLTEKVDILHGQYERAMADELQTMRRSFDQTAEPSFWLCEGYRTITAAHEHEYRLAVFRDALNGCAYVRGGHSVSPETWHVYKSTADSPTGVMLAASFSFCPEANALVEASRVAALPPVQYGEHR